MIGRVSVAQSSILAPADDDVRSATVRIRSGRRKESPDESRRVGNAAQRRVDRSPGIGEFDFVYNSWRDVRCNIRDQIATRGVDRGRFHSRIVGGGAPEPVREVFGNTVVHITGKNPDLVADVLVEADNVLAKVVQLTVTLVQQVATYIGRIGRHERL